jgi:hypothetical protein
MAAPELMQLTRDRDRFARMFEKIRSAINELGFADALVYGLDQTFRRSLGASILFRYALVAQPVPEHAMLPARRGREIEVRMLPGPDPVLAEVDLDAAVVAYRFRQGAVCFGAFKEGVIVGCLWLCLGPYEEDEVRCRFIPLPESEACWDLGLYVTPRLRGGLVFARLWDEANEYLRKHGVKWTLSRIGIANMGSLASHARLGAHRIGTATYLCLGRMQIMLASFSPFVQMSCDAAGMPSLRLTPPAMRSARSVGRG